MNFVFAFSWCEILNSLQILVQISNSRSLSFSVKDPYKTLSERLTKKQECIPVGCAYRPLTDHMPGGVSFLGHGIPACTEADPPCGQNHRQE